MKRPVIHPPRHSPQSTNPKERAGGLKTFSGNKGDLCTLAVFKKEVPPSQPWTESDGHVISPYSEVLGKFNKGLRKTPKKGGNIFENSAAFF